MHLKNRTVSSGFNLLSDNEAIWYLPHSDIRHQLGTLYVIYHHFMIEKYSNI